MGSGNIWTKEEIEILRYLYEDYMDDIKSHYFEFLPRHTYPSIKKKAKSMGFKRSEEAISLMRSSYNKKENAYDLTSNDYGIGYTEDNYEFIFDKEDINIINKYCWHKHQDGYLRTYYDWYRDENGIRHNKYIMLHQLLSNHYFDGKMLDHINGKSFDNRKENLRPIIHMNNMKNLKLYDTNTSGHKGVIQTPNGNWKAYITSDKERYMLGTFNTYDEAVKVREDAERFYFKEYSRDVEYL